MGAFLRDIPVALGRVPKAVLVVSAHWREAAPTVHAGAHPGLLFDYYNFPAETYRLPGPHPARRNSPRASQRFCAPPALNPRRKPRGLGPRRLHSVQGDLARG